MQRIEPPAQPDYGSSPLAHPEYDLNLRDLWNFVLRNRLIIIGVFLAGVVASALATWRATPIYESEVSIRLEDSDPLNPMVSVFGPQLSSASLRIETEMGVLRSRSLAEYVVDSLDMMVGLVEPRGVPRDELLEQISVERWAAPETYRFSRVETGRFAREADRSQAIDTVSVGEVVVSQGAAFRLTSAADRQDRFVVQVTTFPDAVARVLRSFRITRPDVAAAIVAVGYESPDTLLVDDVPNLLARLYIQRRLEGQQTAAFSTVLFLRRQLDSLSLELTHAEDELQAYREGEQVISLQAEASAQVTQLARLQADRNALDAERGALQKLLDVINLEAARDPVRRGQPSPYRRLLAFPSLLQNPATSQLLQSLNGIETERAELLRRRTMEDPDVESLTSRIEELEDQLRSIATTYLEGLANQVESLDQTLTRFGSELARIPAKELAVARLERQSGILREIYMLLQTRLKEAEIAQAAEDPSVRVLDPAVVSSRPVRPRRNLNILLGALFGLMIGIGVAAGRDFLDHSIHTREDVEEASGGLPMLGIIPALVTNGVGAGRKRNGKGPRPAGSQVESRLVVLHSPKDPVTEAYRALRTSLRFSRMGEQPKTVVITSALPRDGKSTTAANLAIALAQQGSKTLLIDGDLRRSVLAEMFGQPLRPGLSNVLVGDIPLKDALRQVEVESGVFLHLLVAGSTPPNPAELIGSPRMEALLRKLEEHYDAIIVDTAPLNLVTDGAILGAHAGGVILVARAAATDRGAIRYASDQLRRVGARVLGTVLNDVDHTRDGYYGSGYGLYQGYYRSYYGEPGKAKT